MSCSEYTDESLPLASTPNASPLASDSASCDTSPIRSPPKNIRSFVKRELERCDTSLDSTTGSGSAKSISFDRIFPAANQCATPPPSPCIVPRYKKRSPSDLLAFSPEPLQPITVPQRARIKCEKQSPTDLMAFSPDSSRCITQRTPERCEKRSPTDLMAFSPGAAQCRQTTPRTPHIIDRCDGQVPLNRSPLSSQRCCRQRSASSPGQTPVCTRAGRGPGRRIFDSSGSSAGSAASSFGSSQCSAARSPPKNVRSFLRRELERCDTTLGTSMSSTCPSFCASTPGSSAKASCSRPTQSQPNLQGFFQRQLDLCDTSQDSSMNSAGSSYYASYPSSSAEHSLGDTCQSPADQLLARMKALLNEAKQRILAGMQSN